MADERINQYYKLLFISVLFSSICLLDTIYVIGSGLEPYTIEVNPVAKDLYKDGKYLYSVVNWTVGWAIVLSFAKFLEKYFDEKLLRFFVSLIFVLVVLDFSTHVSYWTDRLLP